MWDKHGMFLLSEYAIGYKERKEIAIHTHWKILNAFDLMIYKNIAFALNILLLISTDCNLLINMLLKSI